MNLNKLTTGKPVPAEPEWSDFSLERYRLDELDEGEKRALERALEWDSGLRSRLQALEGSDMDLRGKYPLSFFGLEEAAAGNRPAGRPARPRMLPRKMYLAGLAALFLVCFLLPAVHFLRVNGAGSGMALVGGMGENPAQGAIDRPKGSSHVPSGRETGVESPELSLYLKGERETPLSDRAVLREGNTVQLAYTAPAGAEHYGVIFSIDGRSEVTMHYPYGRGQSSLLVSGRQTFLEEAYILDDAPDYEVFIMLVSDRPLDSETVLREARKVAENSTGYIQVIESFGEADGAPRLREPFGGCDVEILTVIKM